MAHTKFDSIATRQIAILAADGFSMSDYSPIKEALEKEGAMLKIVAPHGGTIKCDKGKEHKGTKNNIKEIKEKEVSKEMYIL